MAKDTIRTPSSTYDFIDVGGTRALRAKWEMVQGDVSTIIFTVDVIAYVTSDVEDSTCSRMLEQLTVFGELINSRKFKNTGFIIVFTKIDLLERRLAECPIEE